MKALFKRFYAVAQYVHCMSHFGFRVKASEIERIWNEDVK